MYHDELSRGALTNVPETQKQGFCVVNIQTGEFLNISGKWQKEAVVYATALLADMVGQQVPGNVWRLEKAPAA
jgi:hypothetical protein